MTKLSIKECEEHAKSYVKEYGENDVYAKVYQQLVDVMRENERLRSCLVDGQSPKNYRQDMDPAFTAGGMPYTEILENWYAAQELKIVKKKLSDFETKAAEERKAKEDEFIRNG